MQAPITDTGATQFATEFYGALARDWTLDAAVRAGRDVLIGTPEWLTPVVFLRGPGRLFDLDPPFRPIDHLPPTLPTPVVARPWLIDRVEAWLRHRPGHDAQHLLVSGDLGAGTSGFALSLAAGVSDGTDAGNETARHIKSSLSAAQSCSARTVGGTSDPYTFVSRICEQLIATTPAFASASSTLTERVVPIGTVDDDFQRRLAEPLRGADLGEHEVCILVDGLDEADPPAEGRSVATLVERLAKLRSGVRLLICCSNDDAVLEPFLDIVPPPDRIDLSSPEHTGAVDDDVRRLVVAITAGAITSAQIDEVVQRASGSFLYATQVACQLVAAGAGAVEQTIPTDLGAAYPRSDRSLARARVRRGRCRHRLVTRARAVARLLGRRPGPRADRRARPLAEVGRHATAAARWAVTRNSCARPTAIACCATRRCASCSSPRRHRSAPAPSTPSPPAGASSTRPWRWPRTST